MLKTLSNAFGPAGYEDSVRELIKGCMHKFCDEIHEDSMGNLICHKIGKRFNGKSIILCAHMDEVGFIISNITQDGYLKFQTVGGIDPRVLVSKKVVIGKNRVNGVIGTNPVHFKEDNSNPKISDMYIDIGATSYEDALKYIDLGDYACFDSDYVEFGNGFIKGKALDDRVGCYLLLKTAQKGIDADIYYVFTVQEELGCRGAKIAVKNIDCDFALVIEGTTCSDVPGTDEFGYSTKMCNGPALSMRDGGTYTDIQLTQEIYKTAIDNNILCQYKQTTLGGNDASAIQLCTNGTRVAAISVPCRYIHSQSNVANISDIDNLEKLLSAFIESKVKDCD